MGTPVVESSATVQRNQLTFAAWILVHRFLATKTSSATIASVRTTFHTSGVPKCGLIRG